MTTASLGIRNGSESDSIRVVTGGDTESTRAAKALAEEQGLQLVLFGDGDLSIRQADGSTASVRGYVSGGRVFIRADHPVYTADQLMRHEAGHDRIAKGEIDPDTVRRRVAEEIGAEDLQRLAGMYESAYRGSGLSPDEVWEEIICDSLGDMNVFSGTLDESPVQKLLDETKREAAAEAETGRPRGPPAAADMNTDGKMSREYWRPNLTKNEWSLLNRRLDLEVEHSKNVLDKDTKWLYATEKGVSVFCIYGIGDGTVPTPLYAVGGKRATTYYNKIVKFMEGRTNGSDRSRAGLNRWLEAHLVGNVATSGGIHQSGHRGEDAGDGTFHRGT